MMTEKLSDEEVFLDKKELARRLGVVPRTVDNLMAAGRVPFIRICRLVRFYWQRVKEKLESDIK